MAVLPPIHGPRAAFRDLRAFMRQRSREQVIGAALAILSTILIVILFLVDSQVNTAPPATITFVESWPENRSDAEIVAEQKKDEAERKAFQEERRRQYERLENQLGIH